MFQVILELGSNFFYSHLPTFSVSWLHMLSWVYLLKAMDTYACNNSLGYDKYITEDLLLLATAKSEKRKA